MHRSGDPLHGSYTAAPHSSPSASRMSACIDREIHFTAAVQLRHIRRRPHPGCQRASIGRSTLQQLHSCATLAAVRSWMSTCIDREIHFTAAAQLRHIRRRPLLGYMHRSEESTTIAKKLKDKRCWAGKKTRIKNSITE
ncbi:hypothetical protein [Paenibacillus alvei]|uniref:Uncharacterized protein n=1 Tax=Paenibacillus alvei TaxID=44250 RepID=A0ABT4H3H3_PAEAL|nr:hypothetical protein [Paenibacillus alvei]MCY9763526.1 hypothetical protein [Paenibacillus alvei]